MPVLKHVEFMICCDKCYVSLSSYEVEQQSKNKTISFICKKYGIKKHTGLYLCAKCKTALQKRPD